MFLPSTDKSVIAFTGNECNYFILCKIDLQNSWEVSIARVSPSTEGGRFKHCLWSERFSHGSPLKVLKGMDPGISEMPFGILDVEMDNLVCNWRIYNHANQSLTMSGKVFLTVFTEVRKPNQNASALVPEAGLPLWMKQKRQAGPQPLSLSEIWLWAHVTHLKLLPLCLPHRDGLHLREQWAKINPSILKLLLSGGLDTQWDKQLMQIHFCTDFSAAMLVITPCVTHSDFYYFILIII